MKFTCIAASPNFNDSFVRQFSAWMEGTDNVRVSRRPRVAAFSKGVALIIQRGAEEQVIWIAAGRRITPMADKEPTRLTDEVSVSDAMDLIVSRSLTTAPYDAVAVLIHGTHEDPASSFGNSLDARHDTINCRFHTYPRK